MEGKQWRAGRTWRAGLPLSAVTGLDATTRAAEVHLRIEFLSGLVLARWQSGLSIQGLWNRFGQHFFFAVIPFLVQSSGLQC